MKGAFIVYDSILSPEGFGAVDHVEPCGGTWCRWTNCRCFGSMSTLRGRSPSRLLRDGIGVVGMEDSRGPGSTPLGQQVLTGHCDGMGMVLMVCDLITAYHEQGQGFGGRDVGGQSMSHGSIVKQSWTVGQWAGGRGAHWLFGCRNWQLLCVMCRGSSRVHPS